MRIAVLAALLAILLGPDLRSAAAGPTRLSLSGTPNFPEASGVARLDLQGERLTLALELRGLPGATARGHVGASPLYVVWLVDAKGRWLNLGTLPAAVDGRATRALGPVVVDPARLILAVSAEPRATVAAPSQPQATMILSGQVARLGDDGVRSAGSGFGADWFAPPLFAALGLTLLRVAWRMRSAERAQAAV